MCRAAARPWAAQGRLLCLPGNLLLPCNKMASAARRGAPGVHRLWMQQGVGGTAPCKLHWLLQRHQAPPGGELGAGAGWAQLQGAGGSRGTARPLPAWARGSKAKLGPPPASPRLSAPSESCSGTEDRGDGQQPQPFIEVQSHRATSCPHCACWGCWDRQDTTRASPKWARGGNAA